MKSLIPQREHFNKTELLSPAWTLRKRTRFASCEIWSNQFGFELRLMIDGDDLPRTQVVRTQEDLIRVHKEWRAALVTAGWEGI